MKTVHSQVHSSDPTSLSDATSFLSAYNTSVCGLGGGDAFVGASPDTCLFVRRAVASFQVLEQLHRKLNDRSSDRKPTSTTVGVDPSQSFAASRDVTSKPRISHRHDDIISRRVEAVEQSVGSEIGEIDKKKKKEKKKGIIDENRGRVEEADGESEMGNGEVKKKKKKKKKKRDNVDENPVEIKEEEEEVGEVQMKSGEGKREEKKKKKKNRKSEVLESGEVDGSEELHEKGKKKRKSEVLENSRVDASEEQQEKKKKRRKS